MKSIMYERCRELIGELGRNEVLAPFVMGEVFCAEGQIGKLAMARDKNKGVVAVSPMGLENESVEVRAGRLVGTLAVMACTNVNLGAICHGGITPDGVGAAERVSAMAEEVVRVVNGWGLVLMEREDAPDWCQPRVVVVEDLEVDAKGFANTISKLVLIKVGINLR